MCIEIKRKGQKYYDSKHKLTKSKKKIISNLYKKVWVIVKAR